MTCDDVIMLGHVTSCFLRLCHDVFALKQGAIARCTWGSPAASISIPRSCHTDRVSIRDKNDHASWSCIKCPSIRHANIARMQIQHSRHIAYRIACMVAGAVCDSIQEEQAYAASPAPQLLLCHLGSAAKGYFDLEVTSLLGCPLP